jgi:hypothetical protein
VGTKTTSEQLQRLAVIFPIMKVSFLLAAAIGCAIVLSSLGVNRVLIVPGLAGSQLRADINVGDFCRTLTNRYSLVWISLRWGLCIRYLKLRFDTNSNIYHEQHGVRVIVPGFGQTETVECLTNNWWICRTKAGKYLAMFINYFVARGYRKNVDIRAAPYDWRLAPDNLEQRGYYQQVKNLIEDMYNNKGISIVTHSYGGPVMLYFLNNVVTPCWKKKYIKAFIPLAAPFGGAVKILGTLLFGTPPVDINPNVIPQKIRHYLRGITKSLQSVMFLAPRPDVFGKKVLVRTPSAAYSAQKYKCFFSAINYPIGGLRHQKTLAINAGYKNPEVKTYCLYGLGSPTQRMFLYDSTFPTGIPRIVNGPGDGTVNKESLEVCHRWATKVHIFQGVDHMAIVKSENVLQIIFSIVDNP